MPYPLLLASMAVSAAAAGMQMAGNEKSKAAMEKARSEFAAKQAELQKQSYTVFNTTADKETSAETQKTLNKGAAERKQISEALQQSALPTGTASSATDAATYNVSDPMARAGAAAEAAGGATRSNAITAAGRLASYDDWTAQQRENQAQAQQQIAPINSKARGNAALLPIEMQVASQAGDALNGWGQLAGTVGSTMGLMSGGFGSGAGVTPISEISKYPMFDAMVNRSAAAQAMGNDMANWATGQNNLWSGLMMK